MSRYVPIDWDDPSPRQEQALSDREDAVMRRQVSWDDLSEDAQERFHAAARREIDDEHRDAYDEACIDAHEDAKAWA